MLSIEPCAKTAVTEGVTTLYGVRLVHEAYADAAGDKTSKVVKTVFKSLQEASLTTTIG